jgi:rubrerythrin
MKIRKVTTSQVLTETELQPEHQLYESEDRSHEGVFGIEQFPIDGKSIRTTYICCRCGKSFILDKGRKFCPCCLGPLLVKTIISRKT